MNRRLIGRRLTGRVVAVLCSRVVGVPIAIIVLCLAAVLQFRQSRLAGVPDIGHLFDVEKWGYIEIDPAENAALDYEAAVGLYRGANEPHYEELDAVWEHGWSEASPEVHRWMEDNRAALETWRVGTEKDMHLRVQPAEMTSVNPPSSFFEVRRLLDLVALEAERLRFGGDTDAAWEWHDASLRSTHHLGMNAQMVDRLRAATFYNAYVERILPWSRDETVTAEQLALAVTDVRAAWNLSSPLSASIRAEFFISCDMSSLLALEEVRAEINQFTSRESDFRLPLDTVCS